MTLSECETSIAISESFWGYHYARTALKLTEDLASQWGFSRIVGEIREDNIASIKMHTAWGVTLTDSYRLIDIPQLHREIKMLRFYKDIKGTQ